MKIAVIGGTGFLGRHVVKELSNNGVDYTIFSRNKTEMSKTVVTDFSIKDLVNKLQGYTCIIHMAGKREQSNLISNYHDLECLTNNVFTAAYECNIKDVIYTSSISVYSECEKLPWKESDSHIPISMYGLNKLNSENLAKFFNKNYSMRIRCIRLAHLFGANEKNNYMINLFMRQALKKEQLIVTGDLISKREFLYVCDASKIIYLMLEMNNICNDVINVGSGILLNNYEVAKSINKAFNNPTKIKSVQSQEIVELKSSYMDLNLMKKLGLDKIITPFEKALKEIYLEMKEIENVPILY